MSKFLDDLKDAMDNNESGEFNSSAAKIKDIYNKSEEVLKNKSMAEIENDLNDKIDKTGKVQPFTDDELPEIKSNYEENQKKLDTENKILAVIANIDNMDTEIQNKIYDLKDYMEKQLSVFDENTASYRMLEEKISEIINKF